MNHLTIQHLPELPFEVEESINQLRVNLGFCGDQIKTVMITSSVPNEGKSFIAIHLWRMLAELGSRVLLIDCDLRLSEMRTKYGISSAEKLTGIVHYLAGKVELQDAVYTTNIPNGFFMPVAASVANPTILLENPRFDSMVSAHEQFLFQRVLQLAGVVFNPLICLPLLLVGYGSVAVVGVTTAVTVAKLAANIWFCLSRLHVPFAFRHFSFSLLREIGAFSFFLFLNMIIDQINWSVDKFILGRVIGTGAVAVYGVGALLNTAFINFSTAISSVFAPRVNRIAALQEKSMNAQFTALFTKVGRVQCMILGLIATGIVFFGKYFITHIYATEEYADAYPVALLLILPAMIPLVQNTGIEIQRAVNKHQFRSVIYLVMAVVNTLISIPLASMYGPVGAALGTAISLLFANGLVMNIYYQCAIGLDMLSFWKSISLLSRGFIAPIVFGMWMTRAVRFHGLFDFALWVVLYTVIYALSFWLFGMDRDEKRLVLKPLAYLKHKDV